jgi:hypothetical protein
VGEPPFSGHRDTAPASRPRYSRRPDYDDPFRAMRVSDFMSEATDGRWSLARFTVTERAAFIDQLKTEVNNENWLGRHTPPGDYIGLYRYDPDDAFEEVEVGGQVVRVRSRSDWVPVMSDTPDELRDHGPAIEAATGRVLIHGLGLGCILSAFLAKPDVTHIDVVEVEESVIKLVAPYYAHDPRVHIHHDSCVDKVWPRGTRWNFVWHDIWTHIASYNLSDDSLAEHGISYATLHRKFGRRCDIQMSWAFDMAKLSREHERRIKEREIRWAHEFTAADPERRFKMFVAKDAEMLHADVDPEAWGRYLEIADPERLEMIRRACEEFDAARLDTWLKEYVNA